jgi:hypothetical protein
MCSLLAATYPEKTSALVMIGTYAKRVWDPDYPWAPTLETRGLFFDEIREHWGGPVGLEERAPSVAADPAFRAWWSTYLRMGASPGAALRLTQMNADINVLSVLPLIRVPTLILHRTDDRCLRVEEGRYMAGMIPDARFVELPGEDHLPFVGDQDAILDEIEEFLVGSRHRLNRPRPGHGPVGACRVCVGRDSPCAAGAERTLLRARAQGNRVVQGPPLRSGPRRLHHDVRRSGSRHSLRVRHQRRRAAVRDRCDDRTPHGRMRSLQRPGRRRRGGHVRTSGRARGIV